MFPCAISGLPLAVEEHRVVAQREDAGQLVRHEHDRGARAVPLLEDEVVQAPRGQGVEPRRGLIQVEDRRVEGQGPGQAGPFAHPAADFGRVVVLEAGQAHQGQLEPRDRLRVLGRKGPLLDQGQGDVLGQRHRAPERGSLIEDAEALLQRFALVVVRRPEGLALVEDVAVSGALQADHVPHQRALPAAAVSHHHEDLSASDREGEVPLDHGIAVRHRQVPHFHRRDRRARGRHRPIPWRSTVAMASTTTTSTMPITTACVVACPTAAALRPHRMP